MVWSFSLSQQNECVMLIAARGQRTPYFVNIQNMTAEKCVHFCTTVCVCWAADVAALPLTNRLIRTAALHMCSSWAFSSFYFWSCYRPAHFVIVSLGNWARLYMFTCFNTIDDRVWHLGYTLCVSVGVGMCMCDEGVGIRRD